MQFDMRAKVGDITITDEMVVNPHDYIPYGDSNPHNVHAYILGHEFGPFAIVFADSAQDAIDLAIDEGRMDMLLVSHEDADAMPEEERDELLTGGNAGEYFRQDYLWVDELPNPPFSFVALLTAAYASA